MGGVKGVGKSQMPRKEFAFPGPTSLRESHQTCLVRETRSLPKLRGSHLFFPRVFDRFETLTPNTPLKREDKGPRKHLSGPASFP